MCKSRIVCFLRPKANSDDRVRKLLASRIAATILLLIIDERRSRQTRKKIGLAPRKLKLPFAVSQSIRKHLELLGQEGTGFEKRPEINQQVRLEFDNLPLNYPPCKYLIINTFFLSFGI